MTHLLDTSAVLALYLDESGADRIDSLLTDASTSVGISVLTPFEVADAIKHHSGSTSQGNAGYWRLEMNFLFKQSSPAGPISSAVVRIHVQ